MEKKKEQPGQESNPNSGSGTEKQSGMKSEFEQFKEKAADFAHKVGDKAPDVAESVVEKTKKAAGVIAEKTEEAVTYGKLKIQLHNQRSQLNKALAVLGELTYGLLEKKTKDIAGNDEVLAAAAEIKTLKKTVAGTEKKINTVGKDAK